MLCQEQDVRLQKAWKKLKERQFKRTPSRNILLRFLIDNHGPFSKEEIHQFLGLATVDSVTLYRNLSSLYDIGMIRRTEFRDGISRYEFQEDPLLHHHHVICNQCKNIENIPRCHVLELEEAVVQMGYEKISHSLEFFGICHHCTQKEKQRI